jgi:hypothetical protein
VGGGLFEFEDPTDIEDEPLPKPQIKLDGVRVSYSIQAPRTSSEKSII